MPTYRSWDEVDAEARRRLPLRDWAEQRGIKLAGPQGKQVVICPFCQGRKKAAILERNGTQFFKCFGRGCAANKAMNEVGFMMALTGAGFKDASRAWREAAGIDLAAASREIREAQYPATRPSAVSVSPSVKPAKAGEAPAA